MPRTASIAARAPANDAPPAPVQPERAASNATAAAGRNGERTRTALLDAAERLFSEHGLDGVSMRDIAQAAGVTLALVNYHFGAKEKLYRAVFERRIVPVSAARREALAAVFDRHGQLAPPPIGEVLDALARPWVEMRGEPGGVAYTRLAAREVGDPAEGRRGITADLLDPVAREFMAAMQRALPDRPAAEVAWAYHFFIGALLLILANPDRVTRLSGRLCDIQDDQAVIEQIVGFFCRALDLPAPPAARRAPRRPPNSNPETTQRKAKS